MLLFRSEKGIMYLCASIPDRPSSYSSRFGWFERFKLNIFNMGETINLLLVKKNINTFSKPTKIQGSVKRSPNLDNFGYINCLIFLPWIIKVGRGTNG